MISSICSSVTVSLLGCFVLSIETSGGCDEACGTLVGRYAVVSEGLLFFLLVLAVVRLVSVLMINCNKLFDRLKKKTVAVPSPAGDGSVG